jgi:hypothetical protein
MKTFPFKRIIRELNAQGHCLEFPIALAAVNEEVLLILSGFANPKNL